MAGAKMQNNSIICNRCRISRFRIKYVVTPILGCSSRYHNIIIKTCRFSRIIKLCRIQMVECKALHLCSLWVAMEVASFSIIITRSSQFRSMNMEAIRQLIIGRVWQLDSRIWVQPDLMSKAGNNLF